VQNETQEVRTEKGRGGEVAGEIILCDMSYLHKKVTTVSTNTCNWLHECFRCISNKPLLFRVKEEFERSGDMAL